MSVRKKHRNLIGVQKNRISRRSHTIWMPHAGQGRFCIHFSTEPMPMQRDDARCSPVACALVDCAPHAGLRSYAPRCVPAHLRKEACLDEAAMVDVYWQVCLPYQHHLTISFRDSVAVWWRPRRIGLYNQHFLLNFSVKRNYIYSRLFVMIG